MIDTLAASIQELTTQVVIWGGLLIGAATLLFGGVWYYRRRWLESDDRTGDEPWTLDDLHRMKQAGQISDEEYRVLRESIVAAFRGDKGSGSDTEAKRRNSAMQPPSSPDEETADGEQF